MYASCCQYTIVYVFVCIVLVIVVAFMAGEGVTIGAHRLYSHKSFKAHWLLRLGLVVLQTVAGQVSNNIELT